MTGSFLCRSVMGVRKSSAAIFIMLVEDSDFHLFTFTTKLQRQIYAKFDNIASFVVNLLGREEILGNSIATTIEFYRQLGQAVKITFSNET